MSPSLSLRLQASLVTLAGALMIVGCGGAGDGAPDELALVCRGVPGSARPDPAGDVLVASSQGPQRSARSPSADLVAVGVRRGGDGVVCLTFRTAGTVRGGSTFALGTRQAEGAGGFEEQRYEIQLAPGGVVNVSRPFGEPRYPVRADVVRRGARLRVAMETLLRPDEDFGWRVDLSYLPDFPLGDVYTDALPNRGRWSRFPVSPGR